MRRNVFEFALRSNVLESALQRAKQAEREADRLRMELSVVKDQLDNSEMASARLVVELTAAKDVEQQLSMQIGALRKELRVGAMVAKDAAERAEADLATLRCQLEATRSELARISELNEMRPQLDAARMQMCVFQAELGAARVVGPDSFGGKPAELVSADTQRLLVELNKENSRPDQTSRPEADSPSSQKARAALQDEWWITREPGRTRSKLGAGPRCRTSGGSRESPEEPARNS